MASSREFYRSGLGDRFLDPSFYSAEIREFLRSEESLVNSLSGCFDLLVEVGCMQGRYLNWAVNQSKNYIGIDIVPKYIEAGSLRVLERRLCSRSYRFTLGSAEEIASIVQPTELGMTPGRCLLLFPFNSFLNIPDTDGVLVNLAQSKIPFLVSSYLVSELATQSRTM